MVTQRQSNLVVISPPNYQFNDEAATTSLIDARCFFVELNVANSGIRFGDGVASGYDAISFGPSHEMEAAGAFFSVSGFAITPESWHTGHVGTSEKNEIAAGDAKLLLPSEDRRSICQQQSPPAISTHDPEIQTTPTIPGRSGGERHSLELPETTTANDCSLSHKLQLNAKSVGIVKSAIAQHDCTEAQDKNSQLEPAKIAPIEVQGTEFDAIEGANLNRVVATFRCKREIEVTPAQFAVSIDWGDQSISRGTIIRDGSQFHIAGSHCYVRYGVYSVTVKINAKIGQAETKSTATVHDAGLHANGLFIRATASRAFTGVLAHFRDQNRFSQATDFSAGISWGDGTNSIGTIRANPDGGYDILGTHIYSHAGRYAAEVQIKSKGGNAALARISVRVDAVNIVPRGLTAVAIVGSGSKFTVAEFEDSDRRASAAMYTATIDWMDGTTASARVEPDERGGFRVVGVHRYARPGIYSVRVNVTDSSNRSVMTTGTVRIIS